MRNVCPDCEQNLIPHLHPSLAANPTLICVHRLMEMPSEDLHRMFPAAKSVFREVITKSITQREAATDVRQIR